MLIRRVLVLLLVALAVLPAALTAAPVKAAAQSADIEFYEGYLSQIEGTSPIAGPLDGALVLEGSDQNFASLGVNLSDVMVQVEFTAPDVPAGAIWAVAVAVRQTAEGFHYLVLWPDGTWSFAPSGGGAVQHGTRGAPGPAGSTIALSIAAVGDTAYVGANGSYFATLDLTSSLEPGDVSISANLIGNANPGAAVAYTGFSAWALRSDPVSGPTTNQTPTATEAAVSPTEAPVSPTVAPVSPTDVATVAPTEAATIAAPAAQDDEAIFNSYLQQALSSPILYGPENGMIAHEPDAVTFQPTGANAANFMARVECLSGRPATEGFWDCGFVFRGDGSSHYRVAYVSDGYWFMSVGPNQPEISGTDGPVSASATDKVVLNLIVVGDTGYFGINDQYIATLDLSAVSTAGEVEMGSAFFADTYIEGGGVGFEDLIIWSLDDGTVVQPSPTAAGLGIDVSPTVESGATETAGTTTDLPGVTGNSYTSPSYGYSLSWSDAWTIDSSTLEGETDSLGLSNGAIIADLIGEPWDAAGGSCFDRLVQYYEGREAYTSVQSAIDSSSALPGIWDITGMLTMTYTNEQGVATPYVDYVGCSAIPGQNAIVALEQFVPIADFRNNVDAMDELRAAFLVGDGSVIPAETVEPAETASPVETVGPAETVVAGETPTPGFEDPTPTAGVAELTPTVAAVPSENVIGNTYTSPTFGYSLTWDDTWSVVAEQSSQGIDFVRIGTGSLTADLYAAVSSSTSQQCIDDLFNYYVNDELYSDVEYVTGPDGQPLVEDFGTHAHAVISYTQIDENGNENAQFSEATCYRLEETGAVLILEVYMPPADFVLQRGAISALQDGLVVPGQVTAGATEVPQTPVVEVSETAVSGTSVAPPDVEMAQSATFFLGQVNNSGVQGTGTLEAQPRLVIVTAIVIGGQPGDTVTIQRGSCETIGSGSEPDYIVGELDESGLLRAEIRVRLAALIGGDTYSVVVYPSGDDFTQALSCGEIS